MDSRLSGKTALVTGSSKGIGKAIASELARCGARVIVHGRDAAVVQAAAEEIRQTGSAVYEVVGDATCDTEVAKIVERAQTALGRIDILVNNAGGSSPSAESWEDTKIDTWLSTLDSNVFAAVRFSKLLLPSMRAAKWGRVLNIASDAAIMPPATNPDYSAAKAAMLTMTSSMSKAVAADGVTVNALSPGTIRSAKLERKFREIAVLHASLPVDAPWSLVERAVLPMVGGVPVGRVGELEEIAHVAAFLCSPAASYVTGVNLRVDGGMFSGI